MQTRHLRDVTPLEDWETYVGVKRVREWGPEEEEFVASLPPEEQDLVYELAVRLNVRPVELEDRQGGTTPPALS